jgi:phenylalanyl-tRNA synthetase beta chain
MKVSYNWLQSYFEKKLPAPERLGEALTFSGFELEGIEKKADDSVLDVKVLPDRACYALSHRGIAREVSAALQIPLKRREEKTITESPIADPNIGIDEPKLCTKFVARRIENIKIGPSPVWLRETLETIGQRSINNVVDVTNYVTFDIGRPTHTFDADKVRGKLTMRMAKTGETLMTLDDKLLKLKPIDLVIADESGPVALGGIKGGKTTGVDEQTTSIIIEAANWNPTYVRRASTRTGIRTDASKRFENKLSPVLAEEGMDAVTRLIVEVAGTSKTKVGKTAIITHERVEERRLPVDVSRISYKLGIPLDEKTVVGAFARLGIACEGVDNKLVARIPPERLDLTLPEDLAEEVGRIVGYDNIPCVVPPLLGKETEIPRAFYYEWKIREALAKEGFSEVMTSSFTAKGETAIEKPLAEDKKYARPDLRSDFERALKVNSLNAPLFGTDETKVFEIGKVFPACAEASAGRPKTGEHTALAIGIAGPKKKTAGVLEAAVKAVSDALRVAVEGESKNGVFEANLDATFAKLPEPKKWNISIPAVQSEKFTPFSLFPFIVRDVALFVPSDTKAETVAKVIKENAGSPEQILQGKTCAGTLVVRGPELFDEFSKDGKKSLAFRLVFQSPDRTLSDDEVNRHTEKIYTALKTRGWQVR